MDEFLKELEKMNLTQVNERIANWETEVRSANSKEELDGKEDQLKALQERKSELEDLEQRKQAAIDLQNGTTPDKVVESRKGFNGMSENEKRAKAFVETGKTEMRALLSTGKIAKPTNVSGDISDLADIASDIVDDVHAIPLSGTGAWTVAYKKTNASAADVTDGDEIGGTGATFDYVTINPAEWGITDEISNQVKKMSPLDYKSSIEKSALISLREKASNKIIAAVKASELTEKKYSIPIDANYLKTVVLGFRAIKTKGAVCLYVAQADLLEIGKVRGTNEKKALYEIEFDAGSTTSGTIKEGGMAVRFRVLDGLSVGEQLFGQPGAIDMPMWDNYEISTNEGGEYFKKNQIGIRGIQTAGADLVAYHGMQLISQNPSE